VGCTAIFSSLPSGLQKQKGTLDALLPNYYPPPPVRP
jgi:hypothetical protein